MSFNIIHFFAISSQEIDGWNLNKNQTLCYSRGERLKQYKIYNDFRNEIDIKVWFQRSIFKPKQRMVSKYDYA